ncbi:hypothetical protein ABBQ32_009985 [Trebouxia sp. C0010 RCD-2024]
MAACIRNKLFLEDFAEHQLPLQAYLTVTPVTWMGRKVDARVMAKEDPSDLHRHVYSTILSVKSKAGVAARQSPQAIVGWEAKYQAMMQAELQACVKNGEPMVPCHGCLCGGTMVPSKWKRASEAVRCLLCQHGVRYNVPKPKQNLEQITTDTPEAVTQQLGAQLGSVSSSVPDS